MDKKIIICEKTYAKKKDKNWINKEYLLNSKNHISIIDQIYLNEQFNGCKDAKRELLCKLNSYKQQDIRKNKYIETDFINQDVLIEKLVISKLKCYYCRKLVLFLYENSRDMKQWTLDRLDNSIGHTSENVVICCLKCNLERRCISDKKFLFTKQMRLIKKK